MRRADRVTLRQRFGFRCGYCGISEADTGAELTVDHYQPVTCGGPDAPENWVYCCHACNEFKGDYWAADETRRILHPSRDDLAEHLVERDDGSIEGLTPAGRFHIECLHLNRPGLRSHRRDRRLLEQALRAQAELLRRLDDLERGLEVLAAEIRALQDRLLPE